MDIAGWLLRLGFGRYVPAFLENRIGSDVLADLTEGDLEKLGIPLGDRKRLLRAIKTTAARDLGTIATSEVERGRPERAERRHLTVMICDLVGSTALSSRLDPEDMCAVVDAYHAACARVVLRYDGFLADFRGDGILAYFGYPRAHENDAERAVLAGLELVAAVARVRTPAAQPLAVRVGIATGVVVVGDIGDAVLREHALVGDTPNIAARLQTVAEPGTIVIAESTRRLIGGMFRLRDLGPQMAKGFESPIAAWTIEGLGTSESRFEAVRFDAQSGLIGRARELDFLVERQRMAWKGEGRVVLISGEPGIGKSHLSAALAKCISGTPHTVLSYHCSPYHSNSALHPFIVQLERLTRLKADDSAAQRIQKLETVLAASGLDRNEVAPLFGALLSIPVDERYAQLTLNPTQQRRRTFSALLDLIECLARQQPILFVFEDVHWADATSLELLDLIVDRLRQLPVLALFTSRPEFEPPWKGLANVDVLALGPLDRNDIQTIVSKVAGGRALPTEVMQQIIVKTGGNPLFVEELTKAVLEGGILVENAQRYEINGRLPALAIPATLHDSLMARLDRLPPSTKEFCQVCSAIGREFSYLLLRELIGGDEAMLIDALAHLEQAELVFRRGEPPECMYSFKHVLVQDAAYESLLKSRRQQLHGRIGRALEEKFADTVASEPELLARHFTEANLPDRAIDYWLKAGNLALSRSANAEAVKHLKRGIELTQSQPTSSEYLHRELEFYLALGPAMAATEGYAASETLRVFARARELLGEAGSPQEQMTVLWGAYLAHGMRAEHAAALQVARQFLTLGGRHEHPGMSALGNRFTGQTLYLMGNLVEARVHLERTLAICSANQKTIATYRRFGTDDQVGALTHLGSTLLLLGYPQQSDLSVAKAVSRARELALALTTALSFSNVALLGALGGDPNRAAAFAEEAIAHCAKHGLSDPEHWARFTQGALLAQGGDPRQGIAIMRDAVAAADNNADWNRRTLYLGHIASAHTSLGEPAVALDLLNEAVRLVEIRNEGFFAAELYRLKGHNLFMLNKRREGEAALQRALSIARQQQARWWELRAATSLAQHWTREGKYTDALNLLQPVYDWFVEGLDTAPLKAAKALLKDLGRSDSQHPASISRDPLSKGL